MTTTTIDTQLQKALDAAEKARAKAEELAAQKAAAEAAEADRKRTARTAFEAKRAADFPTTYARPAREARQAFETAVRDGGDYLAAWTTYQAALAIARYELEAIERHTRNQHETEQAALESQRRAFNDRLKQHLSAVGHTGPHPDLAAINAEISQATGRHRHPDDHSPLDPTDVGMRNFTSEADEFNDTDLPAAIGRVITAATNAALTQHQAERAATIAAL